MTGFVFGYGSLAAWEGAGEQPQAAQIAGLRRRWTVAMNNAVDLPGYKYYSRPDTGERPAVHVGFLDATPEPGATLNGFCLTVTPAQLAALDQRERNYERRAATARLADGRRHPVWIYTGTPAARARAIAARAAGTLVVHAGYLHTIRQGFADRGAPGSFDRDTDPPGCPVVELRRHDLP